MTAPDDRQFAESVPLLRPPVRRCIRNQSNDEAAEEQRQHDQPGDDLFPLLVLAVHARQFRRPQSSSCRSRQTSARSAHNDGLVCAAQGSPGLDGHREAA